MMVDKEEYEAIRTGFFGSFPEDARFDEDSDLEGDREHTVYRKTVSAYADDGCWGSLCERVEVQVSKIFEVVSVRWLGGNAYEQLAKCVGEEIREEREMHMYGEGFDHDCESRRTVSVRTHRFQEAEA